MHRLSLLWIALLRAMMGRQSAVQFAVTFLQNESIQDAFSLPLVTENKRG
jgi:hypothetical protein